MNRSVLRLRRGQSLTEFALVLPFLAVLLLAMFEFGMLLYAHVQVSNAAREGARAASLYRSTRFVNTDPDNPAKCDGSLEGWSLQDTLEQAIVIRPLISTGSKKGCRDSSGAIQGSSLGWLAAEPTPTWRIWVTPAQSTFPSANNGMPTPGVTATVTISYPYRLITMWNIVPGLGNPIWIKKSVNMEYHP